MMVLKTCKAKSCVKPWQIIFPSGTVNLLKAAFDLRYNSSFTKAFNTNAVSFSACDVGQILADEGPLTPSIYGRRKELSALMLMHAVINARVCNTPEIGSFLIIRLES